MRKRLEVLSAVIIGMGLLMSSTSLGSSIEINNGSSDSSIGFNKVYFGATTIQKVQEALNEAGFDCGTPDGIAGSGTKAAIEAYQESKGINVNGMITEELVNALLTETSNSISFNQADDPVVPPIDGSFEELNILSFEMEQRDDDSYDEIISTFIISNNSTYDVNYYSVDYIYLDANGNQICKDGRYNDCPFEGGKKSRAKSYSRLDGREKSEIASIEVASYEYRVDDNRYEVNLQTKKASGKDYSDYTHHDAEVAEVDIINFDIVSAGLTSSSYKLDININNTGSVPVIYVSYRMGYFDEEGNYLDNDGRYCDAFINPGNFATSNSYCTDDSVCASVDSAGIYKYEYTLSETDSRGYNHYEINLETGEVYGSLKD